MRRALAVLGATASIAVLIGCGVPDDAKPRAIDPDNVPFALLAPTSSTPEPTIAGPSSLVPAVVYLVGQQGRLIETQRMVRAPATLAKVVSALLSGVTDEDAAGKRRSAIASGTTLRGLDGPIGGLLTVDLSNDLLRVTGRRQIEAVAQIVFTATAVPAVERILFEFEGRRHDVPRGDGELTSEPLDRRDFRGFQPLPPPTSSTTTTSS